MVKSGFIEHKMAEDYYSNPTDRALLAEQAALFETPKGRGKPKENQVGVVPSTSKSRIP